MVEPKKSIVDDANVKPYVSPQQKKQRMITLVIVLIVVALAIGAYYLLVPKVESYQLKSWDTATVTSGSLEKTTEASGMVSIPTQMEVRSPESGYAFSLYVAAGDEVVTGQLLAEMNVPDLEEELSDLRDAYETDLLNLEKTTEQNDISIAKSRREIASLEEDIADAEEDLKRIKRLVAVDSAKQSDLETAEDQLESLFGQLEELEIDLDDDLRLIAIEKKIQSASIERTLIEIERLEDRIASARIVSPMDGEIIAVADSLSVPGSEISDNQSLFTVADPESAVADLELLEQYAATVALGDTVELTISNTTMYGTITQIGRVAQTSSDGLGATIAIRVKPVDPSISLLSGATAVGTLVLGVEEGALMVPRGPFLTTGSQRYVYVIEGDVARRTQVTFGQIEGSIVEVLSGLNEGDVIITSGYQNYIEYETVRLIEGA